MIRLTKINIAYERPIFIDAKIELYHGAFNVLIGPSGCGKTTLLNEIGLLNKKLQSEYWFDKTKLNNQTDFAQLRKFKIGYVFQDNYLFNKLTVKENILFSANIAGLNPTDEEIIKLLKKTRTENLLNKKINELSGGEQQRVAISFALAKKPELLLFDEPTSYLDQENCYLVIDIIKEIVTAGKTVVFVVSHDQRIINKADNLFEIEDTKIVCKHQSIKYLDNVCSIDRNNNFTLKAINQYIEKSKGSISKLLYVVLSFVLAILLFNAGYSNYYQTYVENNIINSTMEEIRIYYGPSKRKSLNEIYQIISKDTIKTISNIQGIKAVIPFYEIFTTVNDNTVLVQSYSTDISSRVEQTFSSKSNIYVSNSMKGLLDDNKLTVMIDEQKYSLDINGILDNDYANNYSDNGNKIIYVPERDFDKLFDINDIEPYLYILKFESTANLNLIVEQISHIDENITVYSSVAIDKLQLLNDQLLTGVENIVKVILACELILIIYDKSKLILARKHEIALLYANGISKNKILKILFLESFNYSVYAVATADILTILLMVLLFDFSIKILKLFMLLNIVFIVILNSISLFVSVLLLNKFSVKSLLEE